jgi:hypothetical protein
MIRSLITIPAHLDATELLDQTARFSCAFWKESVVTHPGLPAEFEMVSFCTRGKYGDCTNSTMEVGAAHLSDWITE